MALEYTVEPKKLNVDTVETAAPGEAEFYGVYAKGINAFWGVGGRGPDSENLSNHLFDFPDQNSAQAFVDHLKENTSQIAALENKESVTVAGVKYNLADADTGRYVADGNLEAGYQTPSVQAWEIDRYLKTGELSPELAANATTHPENMAKLSDFEKQALVHFSESTQQDPSFRAFRELESTHYRNQGAYLPEGVNFRAFTIDDMPKGLRDFVWNPMLGANPEFPKPEPSQEQNLNAAVASPMGGLSMANMAEGATILYSRADTPGVLNTGVLMHNQDTSNGQRLEVLNDQGLRERLYTGADQGGEAAHNRMAAAVGYMTPTDKPLFVAGVDADGKITAQNPQSFGIFHHDEKGDAVPVGQALTAELAEHLKTHIEQGRAPEPVESLKTVSSLSQLRDMLDMPESKPGLAVDDTKPDEPKQDNPKQDKAPVDDPKQDTPKQTVVHQHIGPLSALLMHTANMGHRVARAIRGPDADEWRHRAHAHMDRAQAHLDAIAQHPAVQEYQKMSELKDMPDRAKAMYADALLRNNPDLSAHYAQAADSVEKGQDAAFQMNKKNGRTDPDLLTKASKIKQTASGLPDIESGASSGLFSKLSSFFTSQQTQTMRKP